MKAHNECAHDAVGLDASEAREYAAGRCLSCGFSVPVKRDGEVSGRPFYVIQRPQQ